MLAEAETAFEAILAIERRDLGDEHFDTLTTRHELARVWREQGRLMDAKVEFRMVYGIRRRVLGHHHPKTLAVQRDLEGLA